MEKIKVGIILGLTLSFIFIGAAVSSGRAEQIAPEITTIDLSPYVNMGFKDEIAGDGKGGWTDQGPFNDLRMMPLGEKCFAGVTFNIIDPLDHEGKSCLIFAGPERDYFLSYVKIALKKQPVVAARYLYLLHAIAWAPARGTSVGTIDILREDGTEEIKTVKVGREVRDWWNPVPSPNAVVAWTASNESARVGLYVSRFELKETDSPITGIEITPTKEAVWMIVAMSASSEDTRPCQ
ncbi:hypothetical protein LR003_02505 [candidate division NPL-UPA2 bacterium]|nr:hypothetical protein [candidate division NPL-UPA2 bacterium]